MQRVTLIRWILLGLLIPFIILLAKEFRVKPSPQTKGDGLQILEDNTGRADIIEWTWFLGALLKYKADVGGVEQHSDGSITLLDIENLQIHREGKSPLYLDAALGTVVGEAGNHRFDLSGGVVLRDEEEGLRLEVSALTMEEQTGEARSVGAVRIFTPRYHGTAEQVIYGIEDRPTTLEHLILTSETGDSMKADRATLLDGLRHFELEGAVEFVRGEEYFRTGSLHVWRNTEGDFRRILAVENVEGGLVAKDGSPINFRTVRLDAEWDDEGAEIESLRLQGDAWLQKSGATLSAHSVECLRETAHPDVWTVAASDDVHLESTIGLRPAVLNSAALFARIKDDGQLLQGQASGQVRFQSGETRAEADLIEILPEPLLPSRGEIILTAFGSRPARLLQEEARIRARRIVTDPAGDKLRAEGKVETTLLPGKNSDGTRGVFRADEAVHFVASSLNSERSGDWLQFSGKVRGWQGTRTLSADRISMDRVAGHLTAVGSVSTRLPKNSDKETLNAADYVEISSDSLDYDERDRLAIYRGHCRIQQDEGWLEAESLRVILGEQNAGVQRVDGEGPIVFEYRALGQDGQTSKVAGRGDALVYLPDRERVELFGREHPAEVERVDKSGGTVTGREIHYLLSEGRFEVLSGDHDEVTIRGAGEKP